MLEEELAVGCSYTAIGTMQCVPKSTHVGLWYHLHEAGVARKGL